MHTFSEHKPLFAALIALALALPGAAFTADTPEPPAPAAVKQPAPRTVHKERITLAREAIQAQDWKGAIAVLTEAVQVHPGNPELHNLLGYAYRKQATPDLARAFENYRLALKFDPEHRGANEYIGEAYLMDNNPAKAEEHLAKLKRICGNTTCEEYQDLAQAIAQYKAKAKNK
jgi:Flp pilus assembly protein TadD